MNYYYLAAGLPTLTLGDPPGMSVARFADLCSEHLLRHDAQAARRLLLGPDGTPSRHRFVLAWQRKEAQVRNAIAKTRATRLGRDAEPYLRRDAPYEPAAEKAVADAFTKKTPLEREQALDRFRWRTIEEMAGLDPFTSRAILAYALKFRLCARWAPMNRERGEDEANAIVSRKERA